MTYPFTEKGWVLYKTLNGEATMDTKKNEEKVISLRMGSDEIQAMGRYLVEHADLGLNTSQLIRAAVMKYIRGDAESTSEEQKGSGVFVRLSKMEKDAIALAMEKGAYINEEEFLRDSLRKTIASKIDVFNGNLLETVQSLQP